MLDDRASPIDRDALGRLQALGYASGGGRGQAGARPDPKDRRALAARLSEVISGELQGQALESALRRILEDDPENPQANLRLVRLLDANHARKPSPSEDGDCCSRPNRRRTSRPGPVPGRGAPSRRCMRHPARCRTRRT
jgi:hypothetical protein